MDLNTRAFKGPDTNPAVTGWPALHSITAGAVNAGQAAVAQDNSKPMQVPGKIFVVCGFTFSAAPVTTTAVTLQIVEDLLGTPIYHEQIELPIGFGLTPLDINYPKPIECQSGKSVALVTSASAGGGIKTTGVLRGYTVRAPA